MWFIFATNPICYLFKTCYIVFNNCTKNFLINWRNMMWNAFFQFHNSLYVSSVGMIFKKSPHQKSQGFKSRERLDNAVRKPLEITLSSPKWARNSAVTCRTMWGDAPSCMLSLSTVVDVKQEWRTVEGDSNNVNSWWNASENLEKCSAQSKKDQE